MDLYAACIQLAQLTIDATQSLLRDVNHDYKFYADEWEKSEAYAYLLDNYGDTGVDEYLCDICVEDPAIDVFDLSCKAIDYIKYVSIDDEPPSYDDALYSSLYITPYQTA